MVFLGTDETVKDYLETTERDLPIPRLLKQHYGHTDLGIYANILSGGDLAPGLPVAVPAGIGAGHIDDACGPTESVLRYESIGKIAFRLVCPSSAVGKETNMKMGR